jgi:hypothetical protein
MEKAEFVLNTTENVVKIVSRPLPIVYEQPKSLATSA